MSAQPESLVAQVDPREPVDRLVRDLRARRDGLDERDAARRLEVYGTNELLRRAGRTWPRELIGQFIHPLALLLWVATGLSWLTGAVVLAVTVVAVIVLNAAFAVDQERQAERAVEALVAYMPPHAPCCETASGGKSMPAGSYLVMSRCWPRETECPRMHGCWRARSISTCPR